jgi:hypothetical protein
MRQLGRTAELGAAVRGDKPALAAVAEHEREMTDYGFAAVPAHHQAGWADLTF